MDERLLAAKGVQAGCVGMAQAAGWRLSVGARATLTPCTGARTCGVVMRMSRNDVERLYSEASVRDYRPEQLEVTLADGRTVEAACFILPGTPIGRADPSYLAALLVLAERLDFPEWYLQEIRECG